jgi:hypothetical protein
LSALSSTEYGFLILLTRRSKSRLVPCVAKYKCKGMECVHCSLTCKLNAPTLTTIKPTISALRPLAGNNAARIHSSDAFRTRRQTANQKNLVATPVHTGYMNPRVQLHSLKLTRISFQTKENGHRGFGQYVLRHKPSGPSLPTLRTSCSSNLAKSRSFHHGTHLRYLSSISFVLSF